MDRLSRSQATLTTLDSQEVGRRRKGTCSSHPAARARGPFIFHVPPTRNVVDYDGCSFVFHRSKPSTTRDEAQGWPLPSIQPCCRSHGPMGCRPCCRGGPDSSILGLWALGGGPCPCSNPCPRKSSADPAGLEVRACLLFAGFKLMHGPSSSGVQRVDPGKTPTRVNNLAQGPPGCL